MDQPEPSLAIFLLGRFRAHVDGVPVPTERWTRRKSKALLKILALARGREMHREQITEALWPDSSPDSAANNLNKAILQARRTLEPELASGGGTSRFVHREGDLVRLASEGVWIDVEAFERDVTRTDDAKAIERALALYDGDLLPEDLYEDWASARRDSLRRQYGDAMLTSAVRLAEAGDRAGAIERLAKLIANEPANEVAHARLMRMYWLEGQREKALRQFDACREALRRGLDAEPSEETERLRAEVASGVAAPDPGSGAGTASSGPVRSVGGTAIDERSLCVLPFENESADEGLDYFCDGIAETLINSLSRLGHLRVLARSTSFRYRGARIDPVEVGRELGVGTVVYGRVVQFSERLVVGVELVNVTDGTQRWGQRFDRPEADIFEVQEEISRKVSRELRLELSRAERTRLAHRPTADPLAYQEYLRGRFHWNKRNGVALQRAIESFRRAIDHDPAYALAYSGLADSYALLALYGAKAPNETMPKAKAAAEHALSIDDSLAAVHASLAMALFYHDWDWEGAERAFRRAIDVNPAYATAHHWYHELLTARGRFAEGMEEIRHAESIDPLSIIIKTDVGWGLYFAREYQRAKRHLLASLEMDSQFAVAHLVLGLVRFQCEEVDDAIEDVERAIAASPAPFVIAIAVLGAMHGVRGDIDAARKALRRLRDESTRGFVSAYCEALVHTGLGDTERAFDALDAAVEERYDRLVYLDVDPLFDSLRDHPRFAKLRERIGLSGA